MLGAAQGRGNPMHQETLRFLDSERLDAHLFCKGIGTPNSSGSFH
jgi:hypothetical protein